MNTYDIAIMTNQQWSPAALVHELFTAAQLAPGEGIENAVGRLAALVEAQQPAPSEQQPFGWIKQSEIDSSNDFGGSINLWRQKYDCDVPVYLAQQPAPSAVADLIAALEEARSAINSMKVEAETAGQGDEQMMLEACETISNEGLQADTAIRAALASAPKPSSTPQADSQPAPVRDYPPLPDFETVEQHIYGACRRYITQDMLEPIHNLIRDAIDADRAMRAQAAPASQDAATGLKDGDIAALVNRLRDIAIEYSGTQQLRERIASEIRPRAAGLVGVASQDAEDAARYRWLRSCNLAKHPAVRDGFELGDAHLDAAIDAAKGESNG